VRRFAEATGVLEKTDRIDARVIADYARAKGLTGQAPQSQAQERLRALVTRLRQLAQLKVAQSNQRRLVDEAQVLAAFDEMLALIARQSRALETQIAELLGQNPLWRALDEAFRQIKGVAGRTVARLMAEMPEIGTVSNKAIAKLAGLAPIASDSGKRQGRRPVRGGRAQVRSILVVVAGVVARHDPDLAAFHQRLILAGKPGMTVRVAVARKLLSQRERGRAGPQRVESPPARSSGQAARGVFRDARPAGGESGLDRGARSGLSGRDMSPFPPPPRRSPIRTLAA